jgi:hypothetical protein
MSVSSEIIGRFNAVFGEPRTTDPELFLNEFARCMDGYDEDALRKAADRLIESNVHWPRPAELLAEARRILADQRRFAPREKPEPRKYGPKLSDEELAQREAAHSEMMANFRKFMGRCSTPKDEKPAVDWKAGQRTEFERMQRESPNRGMHMTLEGLSDTSRRITGEHQE